VDTELVKTWLKRAIRTARAFKIAAAIGSVAVGLLILFVSFWMWYGIIWFVSHSFFPLAHGVILLIAAGIMGLVVVVGMRQTWEKLDPLRRQVELARDMGISLTPWSRFGMSYTTNAAWLPEFEIRSMASVINWILCGGVLLVVGSWGAWCQFQRLKQIDVDGCARVIALLHAVARRQAFTEIVEKLPGLNPVKTFDDLHFVDGVLFLSSEPPGLTLHPELKAELKQLSGST
jgi:hypothetical protein